MEMGDLGAALQIAESEEQLELPPRERAATLAEVGDLWRRLGDMAGARKRLDEARRLDPGCDAALAGCAALAEDERRIDDAIRLHEQRIDGLTGAARTDVMEHLASLLPDREQDRIRTLLREIVRASPKRRGALERLIELEQSLGAWDRVDELQRALWKVLEGDEQAQLARKAATLQLEEARNIEAALFWAARADEVAGDDPAVLRLCAQIYRRAGQTAGLIDALERLIEQEGPTPMVSLELAALYDRQALPELAARRLQAHLANHPEDAEGLALLDRSLSRLGRHAERVDVLKRRIALGADPDDAAGFCSELGDVLANSLDDTRGAEQAYRDALARAPGHGPAAERLQQLFRDAERFEELARFLEEFAAQASSGPAQADAWCQLGALRLRTPADPEAARSAYIRATECDPESRAALEGLRQVAATSGDATSLLEACERELSLDPEVPRTLELLQEIIDASRRSGDLPRARRAAERWAELEPEPTALRALAEVSRSRPCSLPARRNAHGSSLDWATSPSSKPTPRA
jgi:tetratricopeptide (TPR) repeat protein